MKMQMPSDEQRLMVESFRTFLASEVAPIVRVFRDRPIPKETLCEITQGIAEFGLPGVGIAQEYGGMGLSQVTEAMLLEELCAVSVEIALCVMANSVVAAALAELPDARAALRERYLPDLLAGRCFGGFCVGGDDSGATAQWDVEGFVIDGEQGGVSNGHYCDFLITRVRMDSGAFRHLLVDRVEHGYESRGVDRPGLGGPTRALVVFGGVRLPASQLIWEEGDSAGPWARLLEKVHVGSGLLAVGLMHAALEVSILAAQDSSGPDKPLATQPLAAARIAEMATRLDAARLMCLRAYSMMDAGVRCQMQASMAQWFAAEMAVQACQEAMQLHGGMGSARALAIERLVRETIALPLSSGTNDVHKLIIARELMGISALA